MPLPFAGKEVKGRQADLLPLQKIPHILAEELAVDGVDVLQVQLAVGARGDFVPVDVIVIQAHEDGLLAVNPVLGSQAMGRGGLAGGAGPRQKHCLGPPGADHIRHLRKPLLMQCLVDPDQLPDFSGGCQLVQIRHVFAVHQAAPALALGEDAEKLGHGRQLGRSVRFQLVRIDEEEASIRREDIPHGEVARRGGHFPVEIIRIIPVAVFAAIFQAPPLQKPGLIPLTLGGKPGNGLLLFGPMPQQRDILRHDLLHLGFQPGHREILGTGYGDKGAGAQGAVHGAHRLRPQLPQGQEHNKLTGTDVHIPPGRVLDPQQPDVPSGGCHGPAHRGPVPFPVLATQGNIIQGKDLTGDPGRQGALG